MGENKRPNQCEKIIRHLNDFGSITQLEAMQEYGIFRLASRMNELKEQGYNFHVKTIKSRNRYGEPVHYAMYIKGE